MTNEELEEKIGLADFRLDKMKDDIHILYEENKQLKERIDKAIEWVNKHIYKYNCKGITIIDWDELSNPKDLLEILGDKENE